MAKRFFILLLGKTGAGKSHTGNMILGNEDAFVTSSSTSTCTSQITWDITTFEGTEIKVVDGPGVGDTELETYESRRMVAEKIIQAISENTLGFHVLLLVIRFGIRHTEEELSTVQFLKEVLGKDFIKNHCVLALSFGDMFEKDKRKELQEKGINQVFASWCAHEKGSFQDLLAECHNRVLLFDNYAEPDKRARQVRELLAMTGAITDRHGLYTSDIFKTAKKEKDRLIAKSKQPRLSEETETKIGLCKNRLAGILNGTVKNKEDEITGVILDLGSIERLIINEDRETGCFNNTLQQIQFAKHSIKTHKKEYMAETSPAATKMMEEAKDILTACFTELKEKSVSPWFTSIGAIAGSVLITTAAVAAAPVVLPIALPVAAVAGVAAAAGAASGAGVGFGINKLAKKK